MSESRLQAELLATAGRCGGYLLGSRAFGWPKDDSDVNIGVAPSMLAELCQAFLHAARAEHPRTGVDRSNNGFRLIPVPGTRRDDVTVLGADVSVLQAVGHPLANTNQHRNPIILVPREDFSALLPARWRTFAHGIRGTRVAEPHRAEAVLGATRGLVPSERWLGHCLVDGSLRAIGTVDTARLEGPQPHLGKWSDVYDRLAGTYAHTRAWPLPIERAIETWSNRLGGRVMELGCGTGRLLRLLDCRPDSFVFGVDASPGMLRSVESPVRALVAGDAGTLPVRDGSVDWIVECKVLEFTDIASVVPEMVRVLSAAPSKGSYPAPRVARLNVRSAPDDPLMAILREVAFQSGSLLRAPVIYTALRSDGPIRSMLEAVGMNVQEVGLGVFPVDIDPADVLRSVRARAWPFLTDASDELLDEVVARVSPVAIDSPRRRSLTVAIEEFHDGDTRERRVGASAS